MLICKPVTCDSKNTIGSQMRVTKNKREVTIQTSNAPNKKRWMWLGALHQALTPCKCTKTWSHVSAYPLSDNSRYIWWVRKRGDKVHGPTHNHFSFHSIQFLSMIKEVDSLNVSNKAASLANMWAMFWHFSNKILMNNILIVGKFDISLIDLLFY